MDDRDAKRPRAEAEPGGLSPVRAFILLGTVAILIAAGVTVFRDPAPAEPRPTSAPSPDYSLTDAEAVAEFERLNDQLMAAYRERNIALAEDAFTSDSPMLPRVRKEIDDLIDSSVVSMSRFEEISTKVAHSSSSSLIVVRVEVLYPRFKTESGRNASGPNYPERQRVKWDLRVADGRWLLHDAVVLRRIVLKGNG